MQTTIVCIASSFSWIAFFTLLIIVISVFVAAVGVLSASKVARQRATLDMIEKVESTPHYRVIQSRFSEYRTTGKFGDLHVPDTPEKKRHRKAVFDYLNHYELVAIGIRNNTLDAAIYRSWMLGPFVRDWNAAADFVQRVRWKYDPESARWTYRHQVFENYQKVARSWSRDAIDLNEDYAEPPPQPEGPGDEFLPEPDGMEPSTEAP